MKNVSLLNNNNSNSPKTPGGISKSLLTPCRRVGLSRNWRKSGTSPFISPLANTSNTNGDEKKESRKRREISSTETCLTVSDGEELNVSNIGTTPKNVATPRRKRSKPVIPDLSQEDNTPHADIIDNEIMTNSNTTPLRNVDMSRRKNSKNLLSTIETTQEDIKPNTLHSESAVNSTVDNTLPSRNVDVLQLKKSNSLKSPSISQAENTPSSDNFIESSFKKAKVIDLIEINSTNENVEVVSTPVRSKSKSKKALALKTSFKESTQPSDNNVPKSEESNSKVEENDEKVAYNIKEKSPNDLKKECVVVIQRKVFKHIKNNNDSNLKMVNQSPTVEIVDSEDDTPLISLHKKKSIEVDINEDDDFVDNNNFKVKPVKMISPKSLQNKVKKKPIKITKSQKDISVIKEVPIDNDDDDNFDNKKTILIRKSYEKITKPIKAKSTGSITQNDIDNLRNRIEAKKKLLLAQSLTPDTEELRTLIKKWQKGCQDALMELLELMRNKFPDKERMDYSDMLKSLKIPPSLVGYDSDNDCFHSPDDASIILGQFKDL